MSTKQQKLDALDAKITELYAQIAQLQDQKTASENRIVDENINIANYETIIDQVTGQKDIFLEIKAGIEAE